MLQVLSGGTPSIASNLTNAVGIALDMAGTVLDKVVEHPVLSIFFALGVIGGLVSVIGSLKHA